MKINFKAVRCATNEVHNGNVEASKYRLRVTRQEPHKRKLAIVGGGRSLINHLDELRDWDGEIWAINYTCDWLSKQGIASKMFTVDSSIKSIPRAELCCGAVLASCIAPEIFDEYPDAECFDLAEDKSLDGICGGSSTVTRSFILAMFLGTLIFISLDVRVLLMMVELM